MLTPEELKLQVDILTTRTDEQTNPNMVYHVNAALNKGLNPEFFEDNHTKIVNAINKLAEDAVRTHNIAKDIAAKVNEILLDVSGDENRAVWEDTKHLMEMDTIIEGIQRILQGKQQDKILGITPADIGKILSVDQASDGEMMVKPIELELDNIPAENIVYFNPDYDHVSNISEAIDMILNNTEELIDNLSWDIIKGKPEIPNALELTDRELVLKSEDGDMSSVDLVTNDDIDEMLMNL